MGKRMKQFSAEFKQDTVAYYNSSGKSVDQVAKELKVGKSTLGKWLCDGRDNSGVVPHNGSGNYGSDQEKENARLKKELRDSQDALEILKNAISILKANQTVPIAYRSILVSEKPWGLLRESGTENLTKSILFERLNQS